MKTSKGSPGTYRSWREYTDPDGTVRTIDREILIMVDSIDHDEDVEQDEYERHTDKVFSDRLARYERSGKSGEDVVNPWDEIEDIKSDPFTLLFPEDAPMDEKVAAILEFMEGLTEAQRDLVYDHLGRGSTSKMSAVRRKPVPERRSLSRLSPTAGIKSSPRAASTSVLRSPASVRSNHCGLTGVVLFPNVTEEEIRPPGADPFIEQEDMKNDESAT